MQAALIPRVSWLYCVAPTKVRFTTTAAAVWEDRIMTIKEEKRFEWRSVAVFCYVTFGPIMTVLVVLWLYSISGCVQTDEPMAAWSTIEVEVTLQFAYSAKEGTCSDVVNFVDGDGDGQCTPTDITWVNVVGGDVGDTVLEGDTLLVTVEMYHDTWADFHVYESGSSLYLGRQVENQSEVNIADAMVRLPDHSYFDVVGFQGDTPVTTSMGVDVWSAEVIGGDADAEVVQTQEVGGIASPVVRIDQKYVFVAYTPN